MLVTRSKAESKNVYTAKERLYVDESGRAVGAEDPTRVRLLAGKGQTITEDEARAAGLLDAPEETEGLEAGGEEPEAKAVTPSDTENKAVRAPASRK